MGDADRLVGRACRRHRIDLGVQGRPVIAEIVDRRAGTIIIVVGLKARAARGLRVLDIVILGAIRNATLPKTVVGLRHPTGMSPGVGLAGCAAAAARATAIGRGITTAARPAAGGYRGLAACRSAGETTHEIVAICAVHLAGGTICPWADIALGPARGGDSVCGGVRARLTAAVTIGTVVSGARRGGRDFSRALRAPVRPVYAAGADARSWIDIVGEG